MAGMIPTISSGVARTARRVTPPPILVESADGC